MTNQYFSLVPYVAHSVLWLTCSFAFAAPPTGSDADLPIEPLPEKLVPLKSRSEAEQDRITAEAWFTQGRILQQREDFSGALKCFQRAARWDARGTAALREIPPLAHELKRVDEAARYAVIAANRGAPQDPILLRRLALYLTEQRQWTRAALLYEQALLQQPGGSDKIEDLGGALTRFELGRLYFLSEDYQKSAASFDKVRGILLDPAQPLGEKSTKILLGKPEETWQLLAESFLAAGQHDEAAALFTKANDAAPDKPLLAFRLARVEIARKNKEAALQKLGEYFASKATTSGTEPYSLLSKLMMDGASDAKAAREEVIKCLQDLLAQDDKNGTLRFYLAEELMDAGRLDEAERLYQQVLSDRPRSEARQRLVELYRRQKNAEKLLEVVGPLVTRTSSLGALRETAQHIAADKELLDKIVAAARDQAKQPPDKRNPGAVLAAALLALDSKQFDVAEELFTVAAADAGENQGEMLLNWGLGLLAEGEHARAAKVLQKIAGDKLLPQRDAAVHYFLAGALAMAKEDAGALAAAKRAAELEPVNPMFEGRLAWVYYHAKDFAKARQSYESLLAKYGDNFKNSALREAVQDSRLALSNVALKQGDFAGAIESLEQVLDEFPEDAGALNDLGYLWIERGQHLQRGVAMVEKAVAAEPGNPSYRDSLGWGYYQLGRYPDAVRELLLAAEKDTSGVIFEHLGDAYHKSGEAAKAREAWQKAAAVFEKDGEREKLEAVLKKIK